ncbi:MAG: hypothetical protein GC192_02665 [Bacteroidetes bacterium]|nr:hypothetical protein [Bacteroidota bacterium]
MAVLSHFIVYIFFCLCNVFLYFFFCLRNFLFHVFFSFFHLLVCLWQMERNLVFSSKFSLTGFITLAGSK